MSVRIAFAALLLCWPLAQGMAQAPPEGPQLVSGQVGVIVLAMPTYPSSDDRWVIPVPFVDLRIARRFYVGDGLGGLSAGAGMYLVERGGLSWSADLALTSDRPRMSTRERVATSSPARTTATRRIPTSRPAACSVTCLRSP